METDLILYRIFHSSLMPEGSAVPVLHMYLRVWRGWRLVQTTFAFNLRSTGMYKADRIQEYAEFLYAEFNMNSQHVSVHEAPGRQIKGMYRGE